MVDLLIQGFLTAVGQKLGEFAMDKAKEYLEQRRTEFQRLSPLDRDNIALMLKEKLANGEYTVVQGIFDTVDSELQNRQRLIQFDKHNTASAIKRAIDSGNYRTRSYNVSRSEALNGSTCDRKIRPKLAIVSAKSRLTLRFSRPPI